MAQQELYLLEVSAGCAAELSAGPPHVHGGKLIDESGLAGVLVGIVSKMARTQTQ